MYIENPIPKLANECRTEQAHEACQANQFHLVALKFLQQHAVVYFAI